MDFYIDWPKYFSIWFVLGILFLCACSRGQNANLLGSEIEDSRESKLEQIGELILTPNESFFSPVGTLRAHLRDRTTGNIYNKNEYYDYIHEWRKLTDTLVFGLDIQNAGTVRISPEMGVSPSQAGSVLEVILMGETREIQLVNTGGKTAYATQDDAIFEKVPKGFHVIGLRLKSLTDPGNEVGYLKRVRISGTTIHNAKNVMRRYRANAVHCRWATANDAPVEISVHELTIGTKHMDFYQPITTPFGYTGSPWSKNTRSFSGYNFSLWSYGAKEEALPFYQESHLIAVGPGLVFGSYGHEGTGVKPRGPHPYERSDTPVQTLAVRMLPGKVYDTYWSYYLDPDDGHWKLYGCGKKFNKTGTLKGLITGAFVEVPGGAHIKRSGHQVCETLYRGWQRDTLGQWHPINTMVGTTGENTISARDWKIKGNQFAMEMGGWAAPGSPKKTLKLENPPPLPYYLKGTYLEELYTMPATFEHRNTTDITSRSVILNLEVTDLGTNTTAKLYWGTKEGLTKEEHWENQKSIPITLGPNRYELQGLNPNTAYFYRIRLINDQGTIWYMDTQKFSTP
ncbi:MAG: DUF3472 domain-containing protein [Bacteroidota bacterium]